MRLIINDKNDTLACQGLKNTLTFLGSQISLRANRLCPEIKREFDMFSSVQLLRPTKELVLLQFARTVDYYYHAHSCLNEARGRGDVERIENSHGGQRAHVKCAHLNRIKKREIINKGRKRKVDTLTRNSSIVLRFNC